MTEWWNRPVLLNHEGSRSDMTRCKDAPVLDKQAYTQAGCRYTVVTRKLWNGCRLSSFLKIIKFCTNHLESE